jgi:hypothetical protein
MNDNIKGILAYAAIGLLAGAMLWMYKAGTTSGYRQGQIDYHNGVVQYKLIEQKDKSTKWMDINIKEVK